MPIQRPAARRKIVHAAAIQLQPFPVGTVLPFGRKLSRKTIDRKSTRLNSSHSQISYAVFCLKKKTSCRSHHQSSLSYFHLRQSHLPPPPLPRIVPGSAPPPSPAL